MYAARSAPHEIRTVSKSERGHGRRETRTLRALAVTPEPFAPEFPYVRQVAELTRDRHVLATGKKQHELVYLITNRPREELGVQEMFDYKRRHWRIENWLNYVKDETFGEDRCTARAQHGARVLSTLRNLAVSIYRLLGVKNIKRAVDCLKRSPLHALQLVGAFS